MALIIFSEMICRVRESGLQLTVRSVLFKTETVLIFNKYAKKKTSSSFQDRFGKLHFLAILDLKSLAQEVGISFSEATNEIAVSLSKVLLLFQLDFFNIFSFLSSIIY